MLHVHHSNRYEVLAGQLLQRLQAPAEDLGALFRPQQVVVPSLALRRALTLDMARQHGVCTQVDFSFLAPWLWSRLAGPGPRRSPLASAPLAWRVYEAFCDPAFVAAHPRLAGYLHGADALMPFELARRSAELLEQYGTYRADGLAAWQAGQPWPGNADHPDAGWQAALWRRLAATDARMADPAAQALVQALPGRAQDAASAAGLAQPAYIFALPTMPPLHLQWLLALARHADLHLYVLNPCSEYWFDLVDERRLAQLKARGREQGFEVGNRLLVTWGRQAQAHLEALAEAAGPQVLDDAQYRHASHASHGATPSLLAQVQDAILDLHEPDPQALAQRGADGSIELHVCHSLTRQLEVLHGHLLGRFAQAEAQAQAGGQPLAPGRVLVALPDLEAAAPLIDAVFGTVPRERSIPYTLTGRPRSRNEAPARALLGLLGLAASRWPASDVFALLQQPLLARRFGLLQGHDDAPLQALHAWLLDAGVHWGRDAAHRASLGLPADAAHTWQDALARLFLGYALPEGQHAPWCGLLPAGHAEGSAAQALGGLWTFVQALAQLQARMAAPLPPAAWVGLLGQTLTQFLQPAPGDETEEDGLRAVQDAIATLATHWSDAAFDQPLPLAVVQAALQAQLDDSAPGGVPGGAVTFAAMASLRGLPYDLVCVLGLDDGAWPGRSPPLEFDLMAAAPRRGDRQRRLDERNVFLDLLLAARQGLFLAYSGRHVRDNSVLPPSVLVSELLDSMGPVARALTVEHPLQAFDPLVFDPASDPRLRSRDVALAQAVRASLQATRQAVESLHATSSQAAETSALSMAANSTETAAHTVDQDGAQAVPSPYASEAVHAEDSEPPDGGDDADAPDTDPRPAFFTAPLPAPTPAAADGVLRIDLPQLQQFFRNPSRSLLQQRLGIRLPEAEDLLADDEDFVPGGAARRALAAQLLPALLQGLPAHQAEALAQAGTTWPGGDLGAATLAAELPALQAFAQRLGAAQAGAEAPPLAARLDSVIAGQAWQLSAHLAGLRAGGAVLWRYAPASGPDLLAAWLQHLLLCLGLQQSGRYDVAPCTTWLGTDGDHVFAPVAQPATELHALLALMARGQCQPLHFFPRAAWARVSRPGAAGAAHGAWQSRPGGPWAEGDDAHHRLALRGVADPLDAQFDALAQAVYGPLLAHLQGPAAAKPAAAAGPGTAPADAPEATP